MTMDDLRKLVRAIIAEAMSVGGDGKLSDDGVDPVTVELVNDYIRQNKKFESSRYGSASDYFLSLEAREYFDFIGFHNYKIIKTRSNAKKGAWMQVVAVEFWPRLSDDVQEGMAVGADGRVEKDWDMQSLEINHDLVTDYIRAHKIGEHKGAGFYADYELPLEAREYFDAIGFQDYTVERCTNQKHPDFGKDYVLVSSFFDVDRK